MLERDAYIWLTAHLSHKGVAISPQVTYHLGACKYIADFVLKRDNVELIIDMKSKATVTPLFKIKKSLMKVHIDKVVNVVYSVQELAKLTAAVFK
ncbi:hypothetical protein MHBO_005175 [Bonamia ostreae]|uniref:Uncharacterized protein n=1 Tax=Bonamia ostreae TaxID=126728 RepID=A0ABV2AVZ2_9EUKA